MDDKVKYALATLAVFAGVFGFYVLSEQALILRVLVVLAGVAAGVAAFWQTQKGAELVVFAGEAIAETKKVVWPSRKETLQTTGIVFAFVVIMAVFLWVTDKTVEYVLYDLILGWKK